MMEPIKITEHIFQIGGPNLTDYRDGTIYLLDIGEPVLIDSGSGFGFEKTIRNIERLGFNPKDISAIILTHCHVDHVGAAHLFKEKYRTSLIMHELDAEIVERGDIRLTAAFCFEVDFKPLYIDTKLQGEAIKIKFGNQDVICVHTPGHTPGSISVYLDMDDTRILFAQDIGAPLLKEFDCDPSAWVRSMDMLFYLNPDILCDGHSGAYKSKELVRQYLQYCIDRQIELGYI
ncbi:MAG TPA: MBL fold metallo-hydrolase [Syntrophorhabdaceae bacterium]|mgnify:FL=1|nr:MBL fold metallo-hydrolase [Syntrophorhabdaceae bacterium]